MQARLSLHLSKCHIVGNHMLRLINYYNGVERSGSVGNDRLARDSLLAELQCVVS